MGPELLITQATEAGAAAAAGSPLGEIIVFWVFAVIGVGAGFAMITLRNIVHAALMLVVNLVAIAALYLALQSSFLGIVQIIVYAGAIVVLFLFVIMLLGVDRDDLLVEVDRKHQVGAVMLTALIAAGVLFAFSGSFSPASSCRGEPEQPAVADVDTLRCVGLAEELAANDGSVSFFAQRLYTRYTFPLEAAALLLVVATIGAIILGRREDPEGPDPAYVPSGPVPSGADVTQARSDAQRILASESGDSNSEDRSSPPLGEERGDSNEGESPTTSPAGHQPDQSPVEGAPSSERRENPRSGSERERDQ